MSNRLIQRILLYHCFRIMNLERNSEMNMLMLLFFFLYLLPMECFRVAFEPVMRKHNFVFKVASSRWYLQFYALIKTEVEHRSFFFPFWLWLRHQHASNDFCCYSLCWKIPYCICQFSPEVADPTNHQQPGLMLPMRKRGKGAGGTDRTRDQHTQRRGKYINWILLSLCFSYFPL